MILLSLNDVLLKKLSPIQVYHYGLSLSMAHI